jgi:GH25 family lysozyme M1 (1,4-beta-N-acetylmuramidase)
LREASALREKLKLSRYLFSTIVFFLLCSSGQQLQAQNRVLGLDVSAWQSSISQTTWNNIHNVNDRDFVFIRSSRGGTTGYYNQNDASNNQGKNTLSQRYDDPYFVQNITRATNAGMLAGAYHFARPDIIESTQNSGGIANSGADEADHFIQMAGAWMRPGYLLPVLDLEAGDSLRTSNQLAQFSIDFANRIYDQMGIRPAVYTNGNYANILQDASSSLRGQLLTAIPTLWSARWPNQSNPNAIPIQTGHPKDTYTPIYGPWDDSDVTHPWSFWQYASTGRLSSFNNGNSNLDLDVAQGGIEFLKDHLVPAVWMNDSSGQWTDLANWNSGQSPHAPVQGFGQVPRVGPLTLPAVRLPGVDDTVILDRPGANLTVTLASGNHTIRKLATKESLEIAGGALTIDYVPTADSTPLSAEFSAPVSLSGSASLSFHTGQVDAGNTLTLAGGTLTFATLDLMPSFSSPAQVLLAGDVTLNPLTSDTARIKAGAGAGAVGSIDLGGARRTITVDDGIGEINVALELPLVNGSLTKSGFGGLAIDAGSSLIGDTLVEGGLLRLQAPMLADDADLHLDNFSAVELGFGGTTDVISSLFINGVSMPAGTYGQIGSGAEYTSAFILGPGMLSVTGGPAVPGDFDGNGVVDANDLTHWQNGFGMSSGATNGDGDADGDADVDGFDFLTWQRNRSAGGSALFAVPEPGSGFVSLVFLAIGSLRRRI